MLHEHGPRSAAHHVESLGLRALHLHGDRPGALLRDAAQRRFDGHGLPLAAAHRADELSRPLHEHLGTGVSRYGALRADHRDQEIASFRAYDCVPYSHDRVVASKGLDRFSWNEGRPPHRPSAEVHRLGSHCEERGQQEKHQH